MKHKSSMLQCKRDATARYQEKTYKRYAIVFRKDDDADIIQEIDDAHLHGITSRELIRSWYEGSNRKSTI